MRFKKPLTYAQGLALHEALRRSLNFELKWLPGLVSESAVLGDSVAIVVRRIARGHSRQPPLPITIELRRSV